jgi:hypothetical protein
LGAFGAKNQNATRNYPKKNNAFRIIWINRNAEKLRQTLDPVSLLGHPKNHGMLG